MSSPPRLQAESVETLWRFARGDMSPASFEEWACRTREMEPGLGPDLYLRAITGEYRGPDASDAMRDAVKAFLRANCPSACACLEMRDLHVVMMGEHDRQFSTLERVKRRGGSMWWLWLARCTACRQHWLVGQEERQNDVFCLRRMGVVEAESVLRGRAWPTDFDRYETLIRLGIAAGIVFRFADPMETKVTMSDLARERPGIRVSELAHLLNLDHDVATAVAKQAIRSRGVDITFDTPPL